MKTLITILIISSFLQSTILPIDITLIILISRAFIREGKANLYLAFGFGLLDGFLSLNILGAKSIIYVVLVQLAQMLSKSRLSGNGVFIIPISFVLLSINQLVTSALNYYSIQLFPKIFLESIISLPVFYTVRFWEERFIVKKELKLRVR